jgi:hypothetical protein
MSGPRAALQAADALLVEHEQREQREQNAWRTAELGAHLGQASAALDASVRGRAAGAADAHSPPSRAAPIWIAGAAARDCSPHTNLRHAVPAADPAELRGADPDRGSGGDRSVSDTAVLSPPPPIWTAGGDRGVSDTAVSSPRRTARRRSEPRARR